MLCARYATSISACDTEAQSVIEAVIEATSSNICCSKGATGATPVVPRYNELCIMLHNALCAAFYHTCVLKMNTYYNFKT